MPALQGFNATVIAYGQTGARSHLPFLPWLHPDITAGSLLHCMRLALRMARR